MRDALKEAGGGRERGMIGVEGGPEEEGSWVTGKGDQVATGVMVLGGREVNKTGTGRRGDFCTCHQWG